MRRGIPVQLFPEKRLTRRQLELTPTTLVVGYIPVVLAALRQLGITPPAPLDYPPALQPWLRRRVWPSTVRDVRQAVLEGSTLSLFVKPRESAKRFTGVVIEHPDHLMTLAGASAATTVWCANVVTWVSEYRVFVLRGAITGVRHYAGDAAVAIDMAEVGRALAAYEQSDTAPAAYGLDFGVLADQQTALIEVNDAIGLGAYGLDDEVYTDMLSARWCELTDCQTRDTDYAMRNA